ncbi:hypothetical protein ACE6JH_31090 [Streptomyces nigra]
MDSAVADEAAGYLLVHDHHVQACREAAELCERLPWLTTAQAEDMSRQYVQQRVDLTRRMLRATVERAEQLRGGVRGPVRGAASGTAPPARARRVRPGGLRGRGERAGVPARPVRPWPAAQRV